MQEKHSFPLTNAILRMITVVYFLFLCLPFLGNRRLLTENECLLTAIPIMIVAVRKRKDTVNLLLSIVASAGIVFYFIAENFLPHSLFYEPYEMTLFGQMTEAIWALSLFAGVYLLALRDLVIAFKESEGNGRRLRIIEFILLGLSAIPGAFVLGLYLLIAIANPHP